MNLWQLVIELIAVGVVLYCINRFVPMEARIKSLLNWVVIVVMVVVVLQSFGVFAYLGHHDTKVPQAGHGCSVGMVGR